MTALERAWADLGRGEPWLARDRLLGVLRDRPADPEVLDALATVYAKLGDLPAAGACWFLTDRSDADPVAAAALDALHGRYRSPVARVNVLPVKFPADRYPAEARRRIADLRNQLAADGWDWTPPARPTRGVSRRRSRRAGTAAPRSSWQEHLVDVAFGALFWGVVVAGNLAIYVFGLVCLLRWIW